MHVSRHKHQAQVHFMFHQKPHKKVLVFSPDEDLAHSLILLLENRFDVFSETNIRRLQQSVGEYVPDVLLVDLLACVSDATKCLEMVKRLQPDIPIVFLKGYAKVGEEIEQELHRLTNWIFYKPINGELIGEVLDTVLNDTKGEAERFR